MLLDKLSALKRSLFCSSDAQNDSHKLISHYQECREFAMHLLFQNVHSVYSVSIIAVVTP